MSDISKLRDLLARVESATLESLPDKNLTLDLVAAFVPAISDFPHQADTFFGDDPLSSIDAAVALCERALPGSDWQFCKSGEGTIIYGGGVEEPQSAGGKAANVPLAFCAAILRAEIDKGGE